MSGGLSLTGLSEKVVSFLTRRFGVRFLSKSLGFLCQPIRKRQCVLETASLHGAAPFRVKGDGLSLRSPNVKSWSKLNRLPLGRQGPLEGVKNRGDRVTARLKRIAALVFQPCNAGAVGARWGDGGSSDDRTGDDDARSRQQAVRVGPQRGSGERQQAGGSLRLLRGRTSIS
jgi:hypothetical protein